MTNKRTSLILLSILIFLIVPFFVLSYYIHPSADDYSSSYLIRAWGRWGYQYFMYNHWQGRYFANFIFSFNPLTFDSFMGYKIFSFILLTAFALSVYYFVFVFFKDQFNAISKVIIVLLLTLLYLNIMPSPSETIYWITGSIEYFIPSVLTLIFLPFVIQGMQKKEHKLINISIASFLGFCICGCNEIYVIFLLEILGLIILFNFKDRKVLKFILPVFVVVILSSVLAIIAPGNYIRMTNFSNANNILYGFKESAVCVIKLFGIHFKSPAFIIITILSLPFLSVIKNKGNKPFMKMNPWMASVLVLFIFISFFFPVSYATGLPSPMRIYNTTSVLFIISWFYLVYLFIHFYDFNIQIPKTIQTLLLVSTIIFFVTGFNKEPGKGITFSGNISRAFYDFALNARKYDNELNTRYGIIKTNKSMGKQNITVPVLSAIPSTIYFIDILQDSTSWINIGTAQYLGINSIKLK